MLVDWMELVRYLILFNLKYLSFKVVVVFLNIFYNVKWLLRNGRLVRKVILKFRVLFFFC